MKPNVAKAGMGPRAASLALVAGLGLTAPVLAGDRALVDYLGYSEDGRYFAFEEFGVQDGSGFPYSNIYIVDLPADSWVPGTPYRVLVKEDEADVGDARDEAAAQAKAKLDALGIGDAVHALAVNGDGDPRTGAGHELTFGRPAYGLEDVTEARTLALETFPLPSSTDCDALLGESALGFALTLDGADVHRDAGTLPASRGCPMDYRIHAVVQPADWTAATGAAVAIISTYPFGFEGPDRRFLAVPLGD